MQKYEYKFVEVPSTPENKENPEGFSPFKIIAQVVSAESHNGWPEFRVLRVGGSIRVPKDSFDAWLYRAA